jgi:hypothetical protein
MRLFCDSFALPAVCLDQRGPKETMVLIHPAKLASAGTISDYAACLALLKQIKLKRRHLQSEEPICLSEFRGIKRLRIEAGFLGDPTRADRLSFIASQPLRAENAVPFRSRSVVGFHPPAFLWKLGPR